MLQLVRARVAASLLRTIHNTGPKCAYPVNQPFRAPVSTLRAALRASMARAGDVEMGEGPSNPAHRRQKDKTSRRENEGHEQAEQGFPPRASSQRTHDQIDSTAEGKDRDQKFKRDKQQGATDGPAGEAETTLETKDKKATTEAPATDAPATDLFVIDVNPTEVDLASVPMAPSPLSQSARAAVDGEEQSALNREARRRLKLIAREREKLQKAAGIEPGSDETNVAIEAKLAAWTTKRDAMKKAREDRKEAKKKSKLVRRVMKKKKMGEGELKRLGRHTTA